MRNGVEGCREVQEDEDADVASCNKKVIGYFNESSLSAVVCSEARLEGLMV